jgi:hypothetical protein
LIGAFILSIDGVPVYSTDEVESALSATLVNASGVDDCSVVITFAIDKSLQRDCLHSMTKSALQADQICHVASVIHSGTSPSRDVFDSGEHIKDLPILGEAFASHLEDIMCHPSLISHVSGPSLKQLLATSPKLTRRILMGRPDWNEWQAAEHTQLDAHHKHHTFGQPMSRPKICTALRAVWNYVLKWNNEKKARICCDGRPLSLNSQSQRCKFSSCYLHCMCITNGHEALYRLICSTRLLCL